MSENSHKYLEIYKEKVNNLQSEIKLIKSLNSKNNEDNFILLSKGR